MNKNGETVAAFEKAFGEYVGAKYAIALCNGTATLHTALVALGVKPGDKVATTPLTMSATSIAILQAGAVPVYADVDPKTWLAENYPLRKETGIAVSLYGLHWPENWAVDIDDAAQTLRSHNKGAAFTSYSFQASKILALGEGGMLVTDSEELATKAREFSSLGYRMKADQPRISSDVLKSPDYERHHSLGWNYRMNDLTAERGLHFLDKHTPNRLDLLRWDRLRAADYYAEAIEGCPWITPQYVPEGWQHDYWCYAIALESKELWKPFTEAIVRHGGEMPYGAWRLTFDEPAFKQYAPLLVTGFSSDNYGVTSYDKVVGTRCPIAESLQPHLVQFQTNDLASAERTAKAVRKAIHSIDMDRINRATRGMETIQRWVRADLIARLGQDSSDTSSGDATGTPCS